MILRIFTLTIIALHCLNAFSMQQFDASLGLAFRSQPLGGGLSGAAGFGQSLWGDPSNSEDFRFGFVRLSGDLTTAGSYNGAGVSFDVHPISFVGFRFARSQNSNSKDYSQFDCVRVDCTGVRSKDSVELKVAGKWQNNFALVRHKREWHSRIGDDNRFFAEPESSLVISPSGRERLSTSLLLLGQELSEDWSFFVAQTQYVTQSTDQRSGQNVFGVVHSRGELTASLGAGYWSTNFSEAQFNILAGLTWSPLKKWLPF